MKIFYAISMRALTLACFILIYIDTSAQVVTTNADAGAGSLRDAITFANANPGTDITFNMPGPTVIILASPLPAITEPTTIHGYSQPGSVIAPIGPNRIITVELNANGILDNGLAIQSDGVTISGMAIYGAGLNGVFVGPGVNAFKIWGCNIGTDATGITTGLGNGQDGIHVGDGTLPCSGIVIGSEGDNFLPIDPNDGTDADEGNVIVGNGIVGPTIFYSGVTCQQANTARISGNFIGIGADSTTSIGNGSAGILFSDGSTSNIIGVEENTSVAQSQVNYIGNNAVGIVLYALSDGNFISGNTIGITPKGANAGNNFPPIPTRGAGILIWGSNNNVVGTNANGNADVEEANTIGFNVVGVFIEAFDAGAPFPPNANDATGNLVMGNFIGTDATKTANYGNIDYGVGIRSDDAMNAVNNIIGADDFSPTIASIQANTIYNNGHAGVVVGLGDFATGFVDFNRISHNSFDNNNGGTPGLSIANSFTQKPLPNDCGDGDAGGNDQLNRPVIASAVSDANLLILKGWAEPGQTLEFYTTNGTTTFTDPSYISGTTLPFGELKNHLITATEGDDGTLNGFTDLDPTSSAYPDDATGVSCTENAFTFSVPLTSLQGPYSGGLDLIAAIAFDNSSGAANTSEPSFVRLSVLPVSLTEFTGKLVEGKSLLKWSTASESNSHYFEVERSGDGTHYTSIGQLAAKGNSTLVTHYNFTDNAPLTGLNYYRLKQVDKDGKYVYSNVVIIRNNGAFVKTQIIPNPVHNTATISIMLSQKEDLQIRLIDGAGKLARTYKFSGTNGENQFLISDLANLPTGIYTLDIRGQQTSIQEKLVKY